MTGLAFGLAPALQATRGDLTVGLKEGGNVQFRRYRHLSLRNVLMASQVAASLALLLIMGFLVLGTAAWRVRMSGSTPRGFMCSRSIRFATGTRRKRRKTFSRS